jgi:hypothetical protein
MKHKYQRPQGDPAKTALFVLVGACLLVLADLFLLNGKDYIWRHSKPSQDNFQKTEAHERHEQYLENGIEPEAESDVYEAAETGAVDPASFYIEQYELDQIVFEGNGLGNYDLVSLGTIITEPEPSSLAPQEENPDYNISPPLPGSIIPKIVIIIDDMGINTYSDEVEMLPGPLTLSYLPYAKKLPSRTARALAQGHELMVHIPMEPMDQTLDGGPVVLRGHQTDTEIVSFLEDGLSKFEGFRGINNHMGSRLTQDRRAMDAIMKTLKERDLYFIDSKTISTSVAAEIAASNGLKFEERDVFLDHELSLGFVEQALEKLERIAAARGYAIAIGHPHPNTIKVLRDWLPTLKERGFELVPASAVVQQEKITAATAQKGTPVAAAFGSEDAELKIWTLLLPAP